MPSQLCLKCGHLSVQPVLPCPACAYDPADPRERIQTRYGSEDYLHPEELRDLSTRIQAGEALTFEPTEMLARSKRLRLERLQAK
jgi:hypothetical protein